MSIDKKKKSASIDETEEPKKKKGKPADDTADEPKPKKKSKPADDEEDEEPKKKSKKADKPEKPGKSKKTAGDKPGENPYRDGSICHKIFSRLQSGKPRSYDAIFKDLEAGDGRRMLSNMMQRGQERGGFNLVKNEDGTYQIKG